MNRAATQPRIAVTHDAKYKVHSYLAAIELAGGTPVALTPATDAILADFDALVLSGGVDADPALYGQQPHPRTERPDPDRDRFEQTWLREALDTNKPVLAICRGLQLFNVFHGGTLVQHLETAFHRKRDSDKSLPAHSIHLVPGTELADILGTEIQVNSRHHQAVDRVGSGLTVSARAEDGIVEGLERPDHPFAIAVQWHPEDMAARDAVQLRLFQKLIAAARVAAH